MIKILNHKSFLEPLIQAAKRHAEIMMEKAIEQGRAEGLEQGMKKGKLEVAKKFIRQVLDCEFIIKMTGLTEECATKIGEYRPP